MPRCPHCNDTHTLGADYCPRTGRPLAGMQKKMNGVVLEDKYRLERGIGRGGMGTIFEARHVFAGNQVAVKLLHESFCQNKVLVKRFYREARAAAAMGHPNIIKIFDMGETDEGTPYIVMELLRGESLGTYLEKHGPCSLGFALNVGIQILSALNAVHNQGIIHRDLKCDNVFLVRSEHKRRARIKLLDFGISKFVDPDLDTLSLTGSGSVIGTPYYMSPEQAAGKRDLDHRLDIYAMGVIMHEMLVGVLPYVASDFHSLIHEIVTSDVKGFRDLRPSIPEELEATVLKALARDRKERWQNAVDMMENLARISDYLSRAQLEEPAVVFVFADGEERTSSANFRSPDISQGMSGTISNKPFTSRNSWRVDPQREKERGSDSVSDAPLIPKSPPEGIWKETPIEAASGRRIVSYEELGYGEERKTISITNVSEIGASRFGKRWLPAFIWGGATAALIVGLTLFYSIFSGSIDGESYEISKPASVAKVDEEEPSYVVEPEEIGRDREKVAGSILLTVRQSPVQAIAFVDGRRVPDGGLELPQGKGQLTLSVEAEGYVTQTRQITPSADISLEVNLTPSKRTKPNTFSRGR